MQFAQKIQNIGKKFLISNKLYHISLFNLFWINLLSNALIRSISYFNLFLHFYLQYIKFAYHFFLFHQYLDKNISLLKV